MTVETLGRPNCYEKLFFGKVLERLQVFMIARFLHDAAGFKH